MLNRTILIIAFLSQSLSHASGQNLSNRLPQPTPGEIAKAQKEMNEVLGKEIGAATTAAARMAVSVKLLKLANDAKETPANRWVLYTESRSLAALAGDSVMARQSLDDQAIAFALDSRLFLAAETAEQLAKGASLTGVGNKPLLDFLYATAEQAIEADDFALCVRMLDLGLTVARQNRKDAATIQRLQARRQTVEDAAKIFEEAKKDNVLMGKYLCFQKGDWRRGLPLLAKSKDEGLAATAKKDLEQPTETRDKTDLGDAWWELAEKAEAAERIGMLRRAIDWYRQAVNDLAGLAKVKTESRIKKGSAEVATADEKSGVAVGGVPSPTIKALTSTKWLHIDANSGKHFYEFSLDGTFLLLGTARHGRYEVSKDSKQIALNWLSDGFKDTIFPNPDINKWKINNDPFRPAK